MSKCGTTGGVCVSLARWLCGVLQHCAGFRDGTTIDPIITQLTRRKCENGLDVDGDHCGAL